GSVSFQKGCPTTVVAAIDRLNPAAAVRGSTPRARAAPPAAIAAPLSRTASSGSGMPAWSTSATRPPGCRAASYPNRMKGAASAARPRNWTAFMVGDLSLNDGDVVDAGTLRLGTTVAAGHLSPCSETSCSETSWSERPCSTTFSDAPARCPRTTASGDRPEPEATRQQAPHADGPEEGRPQDHRDTGQPGQLVGVAVQSGPRTVAGGRRPA